MLAPGAPLTQLRGVGASTAAQLAAAGIVDLRALLSFFPTRSRDVSVCAAPGLEQVGQLVRFPCEVRSTALRFLPGRVLSRSVLPFGLAPCGLLSLSVQAFGLDAGRLLASSFLLLSLQRGNVGIARRRRHGLRA